MGKTKLLSNLLKVVMIFFFAMILLMIIFFISLRFIIGGNEIEVPNIIGKSFKEAFDILNQKNLRISVEGHKYSAEFAEDYVIEQRPMPNHKIKPERVVKVFLSRGGETGTVPRVIGQEITDSESVLKSVGLESGLVIRVHSDEFPRAGYVIAQTPPADIKIERGSKVSLLVSLGPHSSSFSMPNLGGMKLQNATSLIETSGLRLGNITRQESELIKEPNVVIEQNPQPNDLVEERTKVDLVVTYEAPASRISREVKLKYKVPDDLGGQSASRQVKITVEHGGGTIIVVDGTFLSGALLEYTLNIIGTGVAKIYVDDMEWPVEMMDL